MHEPQSLPDAVNASSVAPSSSDSSNGVDFAAGENGVAAVPHPAVTSGDSPSSVAPTTPAFGVAQPLTSPPVPSSTTTSPPLESGVASMPRSMSDPGSMPATAQSPGTYDPAPLPAAVPYGASPYGASAYNPAPPAMPYTPPVYGGDTPSSVPTTSSLPPEPARPSAVATEPIAAQPPRASAMNPVMALLVGGVLACALCGMGMGLQKRMDGVTPNAQQQSAGGALPVVNDKSGNAIINAVRSVGPAVMNVDTTFGKGEQSAEFLPEPGADSNTPRRGKGTGVVIDSAKGLMLTNAHVVAGAQDIQVTTREGKVYRGKVLGADRYNDIAVVKLNTDKLPSARLANFKDPKELAIGQWTIAIGNPYAQANSVTVGVLSAVGRDIPVPGPDGEPQFKLSNMMQTDAAINPGNSGGPLCNINGEVIGINTAIIPFATGLGFTIPISKAKSVADMLIANNGQIPYIGIKMTEVTDALKQEFGLSDKKGALVQSVEPNSPAAQAGVQPGDVLRMVDGKAIIGGEDIQALVRTKKVGSAMVMTIVRNSSTTKTITLKIGARPSQ